MTEDLQNKRKQLLDELHKLDVEINKSYLKSIQNKYYKSKDLKHGFIKTLTIDDTELSVSTINISATLGLYNHVSISKGSIQRISGLYAEITKEEFISEIKAMIPDEILEDLT